MYTYVRRNLEEGYTQGMCDLLAPLLVIFEDGNDDEINEAKHLNHFQKHSLSNVSLF